MNIWFFCISMEEWSTNSKQRLIIAEKLVVASNFVIIGAFHIVVTNYAYFSFHLQYVAVLTGYHRGRKAKETWRDIIYSVKFLVIDQCMTVSSTFINRWPFHRLLWIKQINAVCSHTCYLHVGVDNGWFLVKKSQTEENRLLNISPIAVRLCVRIERVAVWAGRGVGWRHTILNNAQNFYRNHIVFKP